MSATADNVVVEEVVFVTFDQFRAMGNSRTRMRWTSLKQDPTALQVMHNDVVYLGIPVHHAAFSHMSHVSTQ